MIKLILAMLLLIPPGGYFTPAGFTLPGAQVSAYYECSDTGNVLTYRFAATDASRNTYRVPDIDGYPTVSVLTTQPGQATLDGTMLSWHAHGAGDEMWLIGGSGQGCPHSIMAVASVGRVWLPVMVR